MLKRVVQVQDPKCPNPTTSSDWLSQVKRRLIHAHWNGACWACGTPVALAGCHFDHIVDGSHPSCHHGACNKSWNIGPVCHNCNILKGNCPGNWVHFVDHAALSMIHNGDTRPLATISASIMARVESTLYSPVAGIDGDMASFIGMAAHKAAYVITNVGNGQNPVYKTRNG